MSAPATILIEIDPEDPAAYQVTFARPIRHAVVMNVLADLLNRMVEQVELGQTEHPELTVTPIPGGDDDIFGGSN